MAWTETERSAIETVRRTAGGIFSSGEIEFTADAVRTFVETAVDKAAATDAAKAARAVAVAAAKAAKAVAAASADAELGASAGGRGRGGRGRGERGRASRGAGRGRASRGGGRGSVDWKAESAARDARIAQLEELLAAKSDEAEPAGDVAM